METKPEPKVEAKAPVKVETKVPVRQVITSTPVPVRNEVRKEETAPKAEITLPDLTQFLNAGVHFGHKSSRWNPKMRQYIYEERNGVHIIDVIKTMKLLKDALKHVQESSDKGSILIVGTKGQAATAVKTMAEEVGAFYVDNRWPGGLFTNFDVIKKSLEKLMKMEEKIANGAQGLVKKEELMMKRDIARLNDLYSGIKFMDKLPVLMVVIDSRVEKNAIREAKIAGVQVVALMDTNCDPSQATFAIPANDDSIKSIKLFVDLFAQAIKGSRKADSLVALRRDYKAKLEYTRTQFEQEVERKKAMEEAEIERLKTMRAGDTSKVLRVVGK